MEIFAVFFVAWQSGNTKVECGGGIGKKTQTAFKKWRCRESKGTVQERGRKDSENGEPRNIRNPRGQVLKSGRNSKGGALPAAREFCHSPRKLRLSPSELGFPPSRFSLSPRDPGFSPSELSPSPREFRLSQSRLCLSERDFAFPCASFAIIRAA